MCYDGNELCVWMVAYGMEWEAECPVSWEAVLSCHFKQVYLKLLT
jgi:hypothetical protein